MTEYDGSAVLDRKMTEEETREIKITLLPYFHATVASGDEDITDFLDYTFAMISNSKTVEYIVKELIGMDMEFCPEEVAHKLGREVADFIAQLKKGNSVKAEGRDGASGNRVVSLKVDSIDWMCKYTTMQRKNLWAQFTLCSNFSPKKTMP